MHISRARLEADTIIPNVCPAVLWSCQHLYLSFGPLNDILTWIVILSLLIVSNPSVLPRLPGFAFIWSQYNTSRYTSIKDSTIPGHRLKWMKGRCYPQECFEILALQNSCTLLMTCRRSRELENSPFTRLKNFKIPCYGVFDISQTKWNRPSI